MPTLSATLHELSSRDPDCIFIVRRINRLGFATMARRKIVQHFSKYGEVTSLLVAHTAIRPKGRPEAAPRHKASSLGFVVMDSKEAVEAVVAEGPEQQVCGATIRVQKFARLRESAGGDPAAGDELELLACRGAEETGPGPAGPDFRAADCFQ